MTTVSGAVRDRIEARRVLAALDLDDATLDRIERWSTLSWEELRDALHQELMAGALALDDARFTFARDMLALFDGGPRTAESPAGGPLFGVGANVFRPVRDGAP